MTSTGTVDVWLLRTNPPAPVVAGLATLLDPDEQARAGRLDPATRRRFTVSHGAARVIVARCLGTGPERVRWTRGRYGKPALAGEPAGLEVNLSHSGDLSAVAVSRGRPVGVDVQQLLPRLDTDGMSRRYFPPADARYVASAGSPAERADRFTLLWARKEACIKAVGGRLVDGLRLAVHRPADATGGQSGDATGGHSERSTGGQSDHATGDAPAELVVGGPGGAAEVGPAGCIRVRDLPAPAGFRAAVALVGGHPFEAAVRWWPEGSGWLS